MKKVLLLTGLIALTLGPIGCGDKEASGTSTEVATPATQEDERKKQQDLVLEFEKQFLSIDETATDILKTYEQIIEAADKGEVDMTQVYKAADMTMIAYRTALYNGGNVKIPDGLPKEVTSALKEAKDNYKLSFSSRKTAMDHVKSFLDDNKPSTGAKITEEVKFSKEFALKAVTELEKAKELVGLKGEKQQTN